MKYYTKEWYSLSQQGSYHYRLRISDKAESFSEEYYQNIYKKQLKKFLEFQKRMSEVTVDDLYGEEHLNLVVKDSNMTQEECLQVAEDIKQGLLEARKNYVPIVYNEEELIRVSEEGHQYDIERLKKNIPKEILENVADIRVLALGVATKSVKKAIRTWCRKNHREVKLISKAYCKVLELNMNDIGIDIIREFGFHDCTILCSEFREGNFIIQLDNSGGFTSINKVIFHNCSILEKEGELQGARWLYEEIYPSSEGNEYHALVLRQNGEFAYLTVVASDIEFETTK